MVKTSFQDRANLIALGIFIFFFGIGSSAQEKVEPSKVECLSSREYITTYEYLKSKKLIGLSPAKAKEIAHKVSTGCTGAAGRFIKTHQFLSKMGLSSPDTLKTSMQISFKSDEYSEAFREIFKRSFFQKELDLDLNTSFKFASELSLNLEGNVKKAAKAFREVTEYCRSPENMALNIRSCADLGHKIAVATSEQGEILSSVFIELFEFLRSAEGPQFDIEKARKLATKISIHGKTAVDNFKQAYTYGIKKEGHALSVNKSVDFAEKLSLRTLQFKDRIPASKKNN